MDIFLDALLDTARMVPLLLFIYLGIEYAEFRHGKQIRDQVRQAGKAGPILGAIFGCIPQCGFSVLITTLYTQRMVSVGTLLAVYLSTSDEALPIILAQPDKAGLILPLLLTKVLLAVTAGYSVDLFLGRSRGRQVEGEICVTTAGDGPGGLTPGEGVPGCCGHHCPAEPPNRRELLLHPLLHTLRVFGFIFSVSLLLNGVIAHIGADNLGQFLWAGSALQPVLTGLVGLIPNCAASVAITQLYLQEGISFGSTIAGLGAGAGLGLLVLFRENRNPKDTLAILGMLYGISVTAGIAIQYFYG